MFSNARLPLVAIGLALASGCGSSQRTANEPPSFSAYREGELESERQEFIQDAQSRLGELQNEIGRLETRLQHESKFVDAEEQAEWSQALFERKQEHMRLTNELQRAQNASDAEWEEMRGGFMSAIDTLESGVSKIGDEIMHAVSGGGSEPASTGQTEGDMLRADSGMCPLFMENADFEVEVVNDVVVVTMTADDDTAVPEVRSKAQTLASKGEYMPGMTASTTPSAIAAIPVSVTVLSIEDGAKISMRPKNAAHVETLKQAVERDVEMLESGRCATQPQTTGMR